jgi:hypothetical protein
LLAGAMDEIVDMKPARLKRKTSSKTKKKARIVSMNDLKTFTEITVETNAPKEDGDGTIESTGMLSVLGFAGNSPLQKSYFTFA